MYLAKIYPVNALEKTPTIVLIVETKTLLKKYRPKGIASKTPTKFCRVKSLGIHVGGILNNSLAGFIDDKTIQKKGKNMNIPPSTNTTNPNICKN
ncbi:MAG: hypothetical protein U5K53_01880 [Halanaerobiales bacterium]|nr:hypothetical protein [Halanaerobiales bacterium]